MLKLDNNLLQELGLGSLPEDQKRSMLQHIYETLELRVGTNLANQMTDQQLEEFEKFIDEGGDANQAQALQWLEANLPNYKQVVNDVFEQLKLEIKEIAPQLVIASQQQAAVQPGAQAAPAPQPYAQTAPPAGFSAAPPQPAYQPQAPQPQYPQQPAPQPYAAPQPAYPQQPQAPAPQPQPDPTQQPYQFPTQQPPAGPGPQQPPQYPPQQAA